MTSHTDRENARKLLELLAKLPSEQPSSAAPVLPPLSQPFNFADEAALWLHHHKREGDREYGALVLQRPDGKYVATTPIEGEATSFDLERLLAYDRETRTISHPAGYLCVGRYHSHPEYAEQTARSHPHYSADQIKLHQALPSTVDLATTFRHVDVFKNNYISSHDGSLVAYSINPQNASGNPGFGLGSTPESRIKRIVTIGQLRVLDPGTVWSGFRGQITSDWVPHRAGGQ
ncbi:DUF4329 domain-containing protein [Pseudomonas sp. GL-R-26]|uniref:DUF4329 domain-containing protein n=1 Tax=Pseudomonas sp. GL-R-26 TaxID=2832392 RepID=UPI001CC104C8|nr:DUF4329 domain-containing protein [Pseudomonas sp. GL-R-26]